MFHNFFKKPIQPRENFNEWRLIYFISFLLLVGFFVLNMFVGVVVENFHRCRAEQEKEERARRAAKRAKKIEERRRSKEKKHWHFKRERLSDLRLESKYNFFILDSKRGLIYDIFTDKRCAFPRK